MKSEKNSFIYPLLTIAAAVVVWGLAVKLFSIPSYILPGPLQVARAFGEDFHLILFLNIAVVFLM